jgi:F-type H+-transporting ATPase subunit a
MSTSPMHQFEVKPILPFEVFGLDLTITNQALWTGIAMASIIIFFLGGLRRPALVPSRWQSVVELTVDFIAKLVKDSAGKEALAFLPLVLTAFVFIAAMNLLGMVPGSFTVTSQITTTAYMGLMVFVLVVVVGLYKQGFYFFGLFLPKGTPAFLVPLIIPLEVISFLARPLTLAVRLAANMVAGHILLKIFASFCVMLLGVFAAAAAVPLIALVAISALEVFVALLQAYIFTVLTCVYLNDALHGH